MNKQEALDLLLSEPEPGSVIRLRISYPGSPKSYTYAAAEAAGSWYLTGTNGGTGRTWAELIVWLKSKTAEVVSIERATEWEKL